MFSSICIIPFRFNGFFAESLAIMQQREVRMRPHRIVAYAGMLLLSCIVWMSASRPLAWAQAPSDAAIFVDRASLALDEQQYDQALQELRLVRKSGIDRS
jgi:type II secretory pathway component PulM